MEWTDQTLLAAWVVGTHLARLKTLMGDIAATATRDLHLLQQARRLFEDEHRFLRMLCTGNRREEPRGASADNDEINEHARSL
jgi:hypothetical protein